MNLKNLNKVSNGLIFSSTVLLTIGVTTSIAITNIALTIGFLGLIVLATSKSFKFKKGDIPIILLFVQYTLSIFGINIKNSFRNIDIIRFTLPYFILSRLKAKHKLIIHLLAITTIVTSTSIFLNAFFGLRVQHLFNASHIHFHYPPIHATGFLPIDPLAIGCVMMMLSLLFLVLSIYLKNFLYYLSSFFSFASLFLVQERSAILAFIFGLIIIPFFIKVINIKKLSILYIVFFSIILIAFTQVSFLKQRAIGVIKYKRDTSILIRLAEMEAALKAMPKQNLKTILFGFGLHNSDSAILKYKIKYKAKICKKFSLRCSSYYKSNRIGCMDNLYFQILIDYGIIGLLLLFVSFYLIIKNNLTAKLNTELSIAFNKATTIAFLSFLVSAFFFSAFLYTHFVYFLMYILGLNESIKALDQFYTEEKQT